MPFYRIAAATSVAMSLITREGKVSFECCGPYKPSRRLSLGPPRHFVWAPDPDVMLLSGCSEIGTGSSNSPRSANESRFLTFCGEMREIPGVCGGSTRRPGAITSQATVFSVATKRGHGRLRAFSLYSQR